MLKTRGIDDDVERALSGVERVYVAFDLDVLRPDQAAVFMPEPGGPSLTDAEASLRRIAAAAPVAGAGFTALLPDPRNEDVVARLAAALGL